MPAFICKYARNGCFHTPSRAYHDLCAWFISLTLKLFHPPLRDILFATIPPIPFPIGFDNRKQPARARRTLLRASQATSHHTRNSQYICRSVSLFLLQTPRNDTGIFAFCHKHFCDLHVFRKFFPKLHDHRIRFKLRYSFFHKARHGIARRLNEIAFIFWRIPFVFCPIRLEISTQTHRVVAALSQTLRLLISNSNMPSLYSFIKFLKSGSFSSNICFQAR